MSFRLPYPGGRRASLLKESPWLSVRSSAGYHFADRFAACQFFSSFIRCTESGIQLPLSAPRNANALIVNDCKCVRIDRNGELSFFFCLQADPFESAEYRVRRCVRRFFVMQIKLYDLICVNITFIFHSHMSHAAVYPQIPDAALSIG